MRGTYRLESGMYELETEKGDDQKGEASREYPE